jgi:IMP cyclohydrolase
MRIPEAYANLVALNANPYPGRGLVVGLDDTGDNLVQVYWIMGRSPNSRNRVFSADLETGRVFTEAADPSRVKDPSLIIYNAMAETAQPKQYVVSNGHQTDTITQSLRGVFNVDVPGSTLFDALSLHRFEPDGPNWTPRISAVSSWHPYRVQIVVLRRSPWSFACDRSLHSYEDLGAGYGYCVTTYDGDGDPLPSFSGMPYLLPLEGDIDRVAEMFWDFLNAENRVALAVKFIGRQGKADIKIINAYQKV